MEDDAVKARPGLFAKWALAAFFSFHAGSVCAAPLDRVAPFPSRPAVSPLSPFGNTGLTPAPFQGTLLAQAKNAAPIQTTPDPEDPQRFATPAPGQVLDDDDTSDDDKKNKQREQAKPECENDGQCPAQTLCVRQKCQSVNRPLSALLYFHRKGPIGYRLVVPFYYSFWHPERRTKVLFPLFADKINEKDRSRDTWVFPTYQYRREPEMRAHRFWPLFFYQSYGEHGEKGKTVSIVPLFWVTKKTDSSTVALPPILFLYHHNAEKKQTTVGLLPLLVFYRKNPEVTSAFFLALGFYRKTADRSVGGFLPLVFHSRTQEKRHTMVLPLFYDAENYQTGSRTTTAFPFFLYHRGADKTRLLFSPLGGFYHNPEENSTTTVLLLPPTIHRSDTLRRFTTVLPPLSMWYRNKITGASWGYAGPLFFTRDEEGGSDGFFPAYFRFFSRKENKSTFVLLPALAVLHTSRDRKFGFVGPAYGWSSKTGFGGGLLPIFSFAGGDRPHVAVLPPLFTYFADKKAGSSFVSVGPVFARVTTRGEKAGYLAGFFPLLWLQKTGRQNTQMLFPLFYRHRRPYEETLQIGPFYFHRRCPEFVGDTRGAVQAGLVPLLFWKRSVAHSFTVLFPLVWQVRTPKSAALVVGPFFHTTDRVSGATAFGAVPLFYVSHSQKRTLAFGPLFAYHRTAESKTTWVGPYVETVRSMGKLEQVINRAVLPLFFFHCSQGRRATVLFPLFANIQDKDLTFRQVGPVYFGVRTKTLKADLVLPLFFSVRTPTRNTTALLPFFYSSHAGGVAAGLLPLFAFGKSKEATWATTPLGFFYKDEKVTRAAALLFYARLQKDKDDFGVFPLWFYTRRQTAQALFVLPFVYHSRDLAKNRSLTVLGPLFFGRRGPATFAGVAPLFYGRNDGDGSFRFFAVPLVYISHRVGKPADDWVITPILGVNKNGAGFRFWLGPFYLRRQTPVTSAALFPLFYYTRDDKTRTTTSFALPLWFRTSNPGRSVTMVTPLFWHEQTLLRRLSVFFPLFLDVHKLHNSRLTAVGPVVPLVVRLWDQATRSTTWVFPPLLTWVKKRGDGYHSAVVFPLFWYSGGKERSTTVLFPLFYHVRRPASSFTALLPLFAYRRDEQGTRTLFVPPLLTWARNYENGSRDRVVFPFVWHFKRPKQTTTVFFPVGAHWSNEKGHYTLVFNSYFYKGHGARAGAYRFELWPLFHVGRPRLGDLDWSILSGLVGYSREGVQRTLRLLWGVFIPLEPVGAQTSFYGASWRMASGD